MTILCFWALYVVFFKTDVSGSIRSCPYGTVGGQLISQLDLTEGTIVSHIGSILDRGKRFFPL